MQSIDIFFDDKNSKISPHFLIAIEPEIINKIGFMNSNYLNIFNGIVSIHIAYKI